MERRDLAPEQRVVPQTRIIAGPRGAACVESDFSAATLATVPPFASLCPKVLLSGDVAALDGDRDGVVDVVDTCPADRDPEQADLDGDGVGDRCDPDRDGDGIPNGEDPTPSSPDLCNGATPTMWGTQGDDHLVGTGGADVICAGSGSDVVDGGPGDDWIFGGRGVDRLRGVKGPTTWPANGATTSSLATTASTSSSGAPEGPTSASGRNAQDVRGRPGFDQRSKVAGRSLCVIDPATRPRPVGFSKRKEPNRAVGGLASSP